MESTEPRTFYDQHPFDWAPSDSRESVQAVISASLLKMIESLDPSALVLDIGCGPGRVLALLARRGIRCIGLDLSRVSLKLAVDRYQRPGVVADNVRLPFADGVADAVISDGVIHHTEDPQMAFAENWRVLKPGGRMYLAVYKASGRYPWLYRYPGAIIRAGLRRRWAAPLVAIFARMPYFLAHFLRSKGRRTWSGARNLFYDYFVTPQVAFLPREVVEDWCAKQGARVIHYDRGRGVNVHSFCLVKDGSVKPHPDSGATSSAEMLIAERKATV